MSKKLTPAQRAQAEKELQNHLQSAADLMFTLGLKKSNPNNGMKARAINPDKKVEYFMKEAEE